MKSLLRANFLSLLLLLLPPFAQAGDLLPLKENWALRSSDGLHGTGQELSSPGVSLEGWQTITVPNTIIAALASCGVYPDPYYGVNLKKIPGYRPNQWIAMKADSPYYPAWWYRTEFEAPADYANKHLTLHFDGINYRANIWLNGKQIADSDTVVGMFRRFEFDVTGHVHTGAKNVLAVEVTGPGHIEDRKYSTKQLEATAGWDDHNPIPPDMNTGIWRDVYLRATGPVALRHPFVASDLKLPSLDSADLSVSVQVSNVTDQPIEGELVADVQDIPKPIRKPVRLDAKETKTVTITPADDPALHVVNPRVWWPNPMQEQPLYTLKLQFMIGDKPSDDTRINFGIRETTSYLEDGWRQYMVNGRKVLIRGGVWMTPDMLLRLPPERDEALVRYAREAGFNMLRSEGFSIKGTPAAYDACDRYGIMVTQQIFGRNIPDEALAIACAEDMILEVRHHPSLVHFIAHDETFPTKTLDQAYQDLIAKYVPEATYQPNSGDENKTRFETGGTRTGCRFLWTYADPSFYYKDYVNPNDPYDAWGFAQSGGIGGIVAPYESIRRFIPKEDMWPLWSEGMEFHTINTQNGQNARFFELVVQQLEQRYGKADGIEDFCRKAMALNYDSARGMFEAWARNKYRAKGITTWKYVMAWPAVMSWQYVDWNLFVGGAYYGAKKACEPLHLQYSYDDRSVWVVNARYDDRRGLKASSVLYNFDLTEKSRKAATVDVGPDGKTHAFTIDVPPDLTKTYFLKLMLDDEKGNRVSDSLYWLSTKPEKLGSINESWTDFAVQMESTADFTALSSLKSVALDGTSHFREVEGEQCAEVTVKNPTDTLAFMVHLAATQGPGGDEVAPTYWQDNYFSLLPGESRTVTARFAPSGLNGKPPAIMVDGWNIGKTALASTGN